MIKVRIKRKKSKKNTLKEERIRMSLDLKKDKWVYLYERYREFIKSLTEEEKRQIRVWACPQTCSPKEIDMWIKATKGTLEKAVK